jgi:hypothetical protein
LRWLSSGRDFKNKEEEKQMPKGNPGRLKSRFEIRGETVPNEYEFQQHHAEMTEQEHENFPPAEGQEGEASVSLTPQAREAARISEMEAHAHEIAERRRAKRAKSESKGTKKSAGKKKSAAKKRPGASKSRSAGGSKKSAAKKATKKAAKKVAGKSGAKKSGKKGAAKSAKTGAGKKSAKRR